MSHPSRPSGQGLGADVLPSVISALDEESGLHAEMWEIRGRRAAGRSTRDDHRRYRACWRTLAIRRSRRRCTILSVEFDEQLELRTALLEEIHNERARRAVDAVFGATPEDESPATGAEPVPR